jgi:hypothetical protein
MPFPKVIPPRSVVTLIRGDEGAGSLQRDVGRRFRIGYYRPSAGLDVIWLVNEQGEYEQSIDHEFLLRYFVVDKLSNETDLYGRRRPQLGRLKIRRPLAKA